MKKILLIFAVALFVVNCKNKSVKKTEQNKPKTSMIKKYTFDLQGHRGARGLAPENTLPAFKKALEIGVNTIELDVVITKDKQVLVSHEPWLNAATCLDFSGNKITKEDEMKYNIYTYTYNEIKKVDCGSLGNEKFPEQKKQKASKPLLADVIDLVTSYSAKNNIVVNYNIEIKSDKRGDNLYHPAPSDFSDLVVAVLKNKNVKTNNVTIQSFDVRVLQYLNKKYPSYTLAYLVYKDDVETNLKTLGFTPKIYSPEYKMLNKEIIAHLHKKGVKVIPWTVNDVEEMKKLLRWNVDGIITDYPNIAKLLKN